MKKFAFISRHTPTEKQFELALAQGIELEQVGDRDAFSVNPDDFAGYDGVVVVHPAMALKLASTFAVGVFENAMRPVPGGASQFEAKALHIYENAISK